ncbi:Zinc metalloproteinase dpy-31, partial [Lamellibrachia satsuma]
MLIRLVTATLLLATFVAGRHARASCGDSPNTWRSKLDRWWKQQREIWRTRSSADQQDPSWTPPGFGRFDQFPPQFPERLGRYQGMPDFDQLNAEWTPPGRESRVDWLARHGAKKDVYDETLSLVKRCKTTMLKQEGYKVTKKEVAEMDMFLFGSLPTLQQAEACVELHKRRHKRKLLNFKVLPVYMWPMPIIYKYDGTHNAEAKKMIEAAIKHWESETCIRFRRVDTNTTVTEQHLLFTSQANCYSYTGRVPKSTAFPQQINLNSYGCTNWLGLPVHEIGHAIGFWHEHVRTDRDKYVTVNMSYIYWWYRINYVKLNSTLVDNRNVPYDHGSLMHYSATELSIGTLRSLQPTNPLYEKTMGQRVGLSFFDAKLANLAYCKDKCAGVKPFVRCYNGGYRDPNDCSKCKCPEGFGRWRCRYQARVHGGCRPTSSGYFYVRSTRERCVSSRNYDQADGKGAYRNGDKCNWLFK